jgi:hypothetical protein
MADDADIDRDGGKAALERRARLGAALRENLRKRKAATRLRRAQNDDAGPKARQPGDGRDG